MRKQIILFITIITLIFTSCDTMTNTNKDYMDINTLEQYAKTFTGNCILKYADGSLEETSGTVKFYGILECYDNISKKCIWSEQYKYSWTNNNINYTVTFCEKTNSVCGLSGYNNIESAPTLFTFTKKDNTIITISKFF